MLAQSQPPGCPYVPRIGGQKVSFAHLPWLHEIERVLQAVAINHGGLWHLKQETSFTFPIHPIEDPAQPDLLKQQPPSAPKATDCDPVGMGSRKTGESPAWKQSDVFPIIAEVIGQLYQQHRRFITAREISTHLLLNSKGRTFVAAADEARKNKKTLEWEAGKMVAWFSARISSGETEWVCAFERTRIEGQWAYKPI